ncbi:MAG: hypothetical protein WC152_06990 [Candidatus Izemoplasmatales bacterium]
MKSKRLFVLLMVFMLTIIVVACGGKTTESSTTGTPTTGTPTTSVPTTSVPTTDVTTTVAQLQTKSIINGWVDSGDEVYTITQDDDELAVSYDKNSFSWASISYVIDEDLSVFNKLMIAISGQGTLLIKIQGATEAFEVEVQLTAGEVLYQLDLRDYDEFLEGVTGVYLFGAPGKAVDTGSFTVSLFEFHEGTAYGNVMENGDSNVPQNEQVYDGTGEIFDFSAGFIDNGDGIYTIDKSGEDIAVEYTKAVGFEWAYMISSVRGDFSDFDYVVLKVEGVTAGEVTLKAELSSSVQVELEGNYAPGEELILCLDLSTWTDDQLDALTKILVFADGGSGSASGEFNIVEAYFSKVFVGTPPVVPVDYYDFLTGWVEQDTGTYTFTDTVDDTVLVEYTKAAEQTYVLMKNEFTTEASEYNTLTLVLKGTTGKTVLIKPNDDYLLEETLTFDGTEQEVVVSANVFTKIMLFAEPGSENVTGSFEIISARLTYVEPDPLAASEVYDFNSLWVDNDGDIFTFTPNAGVVTVDWLKTDGDAQQWAYMIAQFEEKLLNHDTIEIVVKGTTGQQILIKPNNSSTYEQTITFDGTEQTITFDLTNEPISLIIFADPFNKGLTGSFEIISAVVKASNTTQVNFLYDFNENDADTYELTTLADGSVQVDYTKGVGQEWVFMKAEFDPVIVDGKNTLTLVISGTSGKTIMLKPNDDGTMEQTITFDGTEQTVIISADAFTKLLIFAEAETASVNGTFIIHSAKLTYVEPGYTFESLWAENDPDTYAFTINEDNSVLVEYTKIAGQEWAYMKADFPAAEVEGFNTLTITVQGTAGKRLLIKPNNSGALERYITFTGDEETFIFTADSFQTLIIFAEDNIAPATGSFVILSATLSYVLPEPIPAEQEYVLGNKWIDNDDGIYTFTETAGVVTVTYDRLASEAWAYMVYDIDDNLSEHDTLTFVVNGTSGAKLLIKPNDSNLMETWVTFDGTDQTITIDLLTTLTKILLFIDPENASLTGTFDIVTAKTSSSGALPIPAEQEYVLGNEWIDNDDGIYTFTETDGVVTVTYDRLASEAWAYMVYDIDDNLSEHNTLTFVVTGTSGAKLLIKPNDSNLMETWVTFDGTEQTITIDLLTTLTKILLFIDPENASLTGTFDIVSATVTAEE